MPEQVVGRVSQTTTIAATTTTKSAAASTTRSQAMRASRQDRTAMGLCTVFAKGVSRKSAKVSSL